MGLPLRLARGSVWNSFKPTIQKRQHFVKSDRESNNVVNLVSQIVVGVGGGGGHRIGEETYSR